MKRLFLFSLFILSFNAYAKNKISMVTYFPVPYVAYSQVNASQMDVGLTNTCHMKLGCEESQSPLITPKVNVQSGRLDLNNGRGILGQSITLGSGTGTGRLSFSNVRMQAGKIQSVNATDVNTTTLNLFGKNFPSCKEKDSSGQMSWKSLKLKGASSKELYLTCGEGQQSACRPTNNGQEVYAEECPAGQTGTVTYTWDYAACKYNESANCEQAPGVNLSIKQQGCPVRWDYSGNRCKVESPGTYAAGSTVKIKAVPFDPGAFKIDTYKYKFVKWELSSCPGGKIANVNNEETTLTLGNGDCELTANYRSLITLHLSSNIPNTWNEFTGQGYYEPGTTVTISVRNIKGNKKFDNWWSPGNCTGSTLHDSRTATTKVTLPSEETPCLYYANLY